MSKKGKLKCLDYDQQFKEDLEKAQALSLESLALEKFRTEKNNSQHRHQKGDVPRIPPPPPVLRRNSVTTNTSCSTPATDLISFNSPTNKKHSEVTINKQFDFRSKKNDIRPIGIDLPGIAPLSGRSYQYPKHASYNCFYPSPRNVPQNISRLGIKPGSSPENSSSVSNELNVSSYKGLSKKDDSNLIDLTSSDMFQNNDKDETVKNVRVSLLEAFDPLMSSSSSKADKEDHSEENIYDQYDPFDFLSSPPSLASQNSDPLYSAVVKAPQTPTYSHPVPSQSQTPKSALKKCDSRSRLSDILVIKKRRCAHYDSDLLAFHSVVNNLREEFHHDDKITNIGLIISPKIENFYNIGTSIKIVIHYQKNENPFIFTCDVSTSVEHIIMNVACELGSGQVSDYVLQVRGLDEYLEPETTLSDYEYVHQCIKLEKDIELSLVHINDLQRPLARTVDDDKNETKLSLDDLMPKELIQPISYDSLLILLETVEKEIERVENAFKECGNGAVLNVQPKAVLQAVKAVCALLGNIETIQISQALENFILACEQFPRNQEDVKSKPEIIGEYGEYSVIRIPEETLLGTIHLHCEQVRAAVQGLLETYSNVFRVDFQLNTPRHSLVKKISSDISDSVLIYIGCLHRIPQKWHYENYLIAAQIYYGTRPIGQPVLSDLVTVSSNLYRKIVVDTWLNFEGTAVSVLSRECRIIVVVYGRSTIEEVVQQHELGWAAIQIFNYDGVLVQGSFLLPLWPAEADKRYGPAPSPGIHPYGDTHPVIGLELPDYGSEVSFPTFENNTPPFSQETYDFNSLDQNTQHQLMEIISQDIFSNPLVEDREVLWEKRHYLLNHPQALPKVLLAAHSWDYTCLPDLYSMLHSWAPLDPVNALQLLLPCFPDSEVRAVAVNSVKQLRNDQFVDYLPQLVQALKHETYEASPLARLLLEKALISPRVAHHLYWLLIQALPGQTPQNTSEVHLADEINLSDARYYRRYQLILRALLAISGDALRNRFMSQQLLVKGLTEIAESVKSSKEATRLNVLMQGLHILHSSLSETPTCLPHSPSLYVTGIQVRSSSYFPSNTLPLKINFTTNESSVTPAIFKVGDDLQQDMLTLQMIRVMDKLWLKEGLDLKMVTFTCVPTGYKKGMIEMVTDAETLRKIQVEFGLTGSFKDRPIAEWLAKHNPSALDYERAVSNFTASCAGYSVATYILGICDRHNDNIMLKTSGHLFHIDFGKFLGDAQMFGNFKRDRTPFVLTSDMAYVINGGDKPSVRFHHFVDLCCKAFNIVRKHGNILLNLFGLMASSGAGGLTADAVRYVQTALLPELSNAEAAATFARMIQSSLKSWFTQFNFFLHNLAQLRFSGDHNDGQLLSFVNKTYTMQQEGRLLSVHVYGCQKRYDPEKYYLYILRVERANQPDPSYLFRSYKEFCEFHQKLCIMFPLAKCHSLQSTGLHVGRSNIRQVAEKRLIDIKKFLSTLFNMADEICHSDVVYTFFHPLLRDQQESSIHEAKLKDKRRERVDRNTASIIRGQIKLSLHYQRETFKVMVHHVRELSFLTSGQEPSTYVKVYLIPDSSKVTKRKTKVLRRSCHPSFMEMLEYRLPLEIVQSRSLQATVWNHDTLQENEFLGGTTIQLSEIDITVETTEWYPLRNVVR